MGLGRRRDIRDGEERLGVAEILFQHEAIATQILPLRPPYPIANSPVPLPQSDPQIGWRCQTLLPCTFVQDFVMSIKYLLEVTSVRLAPGLFRVSLAAISPLVQMALPEVSHYFWCLVTEARHSISWQKDCPCFAVNQVQGNQEHCFTSTAYR